MLSSFVSHRPKTPRLKVEILSLVIMVALAVQLSGILRVLALIETLLLAMRLFHFKISWRSERA